MLAASCPALISDAFAAGVYTWTAVTGESFRRPHAWAAPAACSLLSRSTTRRRGGRLGFQRRFSGVDVVKPAAGDYTIVALDNSKTPSAGSYAMELLRTKKPAPVSLPQGQTLAAVVSATAPFAAYSFTAGVRRHAGAAQRVSTAGSAAGHS